MCSLFWCNSAHCHCSPAAGKTHSVQHISAPLSCCGEYHYNLSNIGSTALMSAVNDTFITVYKAAEHISTACCHGCGSILTEIEKLLHGKRWGGEFGEMFNMFGRTGQSGVFHDKPNELHYCSCFPGIPLAEPAPRLLWGMGGAAVEVDPAPANGKAITVNASRRRANGRSCGRDVLQARPRLARPHIYYYVTFVSGQLGEKQLIIGTMCV